MSSRQDRPASGSAACSSGAAPAEPGHRRRHRQRAHQSEVWPEASITTPLGAELGYDSQRELDRLYRATLQALADGLILGRGRHGVVVALCNEPSDPRFRLAVKVVSKVFTSSRGREASFHRSVAHSLHVQNEVAAMAKLSTHAAFVMPLYCAFQDDGYVFLVMERACCSLKQLIQHNDALEQQQLLAFQEAHPLKFISFAALTSATMLHACWCLEKAALIHHDIHPAQILVTSDGRPRLADLGQCSVIPPSGRKTLLPPLGRRDFCRPAKLGPLQGSEVDGYGCGATLWVTWKGCYDGTNKIARDWNRHEERDALERRIEYLARKALDAPPSKWHFAQKVHAHLRTCDPHEFALSMRELIETLVTACQEEGSASRSTFSAEVPFERHLPFLRLTPGLAIDPVVCLENANFALPVVRPEEPWPPPRGNVLEPVYVHAVRMLRGLDEREAHGAGGGGSNGGGRHRSRDRPTRPLLPELPVALNARPCLSMLLHPGRASAPADAPAVRIALVSMLVRDELPSEIPITVRVAPWPSHHSGGSGAALEPSDAVIYTVLREEFAQEGPSGPVEAKRVLHLRPAVALGRHRVTFELPAEVLLALGLCATPPLRLDMTPPPGAEADMGRVAGSLRSLAIS